MVFNINKNINTAKSLIEKNDTDQLYYACLELRYALEKITYQKLKQRLDKITIEEISSWQPKRALDRLMELVDEHLGQDTTLSMAREDQYGVAPDAAKFFHVGTTKGIDPKKIGKHWQKLGSFLHIKMPQTKSDHPEKPDATTLKEYLGEVIDYIEKLTSTSFDSFFSMNVTVKCSRCEQSIVRNSKLLKEGDIVQCQNPQCPASYIVHKKEEDFIFEPYLFTLECDKCGQKADYEANAFLKMSYRDSYRAKCNGCGAEHNVRWSLEHVPVHEKKEA